LLRAKIKQIIPEYQWEPSVKKAKSEANARDFPELEEREQALSA